MAVPTPPTVVGVVTEGLKRGGRVSPNSTDITNAQNIHFQEVKTDIMRLAPRHPTLITTAVIPTVVGQSVYASPSTSNGIQSLSIWDGPDDLRGTAQAGAATSITLASSTSTKALGDMQGRFIALTGGTGSTQYSQITNWVPATQVATVKDTWTTNPDSTTTYLVVSYQRKLFDLSKPYDWNIINQTYGMGLAYRAMIQDDTIWLDYTPDKVYAILVDYWQDLTKMDEAGSTFLGFLQKHQTTFTQGIAVKTGQRFDDTRYQLEVSIYNDMLDKLGSESGSSQQVTFKDV